MKNSWIKQNLANVITSTRILATVAMLFTETLSTVFFVEYTYAGLTDLVDGPIARSTKTESKFGAKLDSAADLMFYITMMVKVLPFLKIYLSSKVLKLIYIIFAIRVCLYTFVGLTHHYFMSNHTIFNKATGFSIFFVPYFMKTSFFTIYALLVCAIAAAAIVYEIILLARNKQEKPKQIE